MEEGVSKRLWDSRIATWKARIFLWNDNNPLEALAAKGGKVAPSSKDKDAKPRRRVAPTPVEEVATGAGAGAGAGADAGAGAGAETSAPETVADVTKNDDDI